MRTKDRYGYRFAEEAVTACRSVGQEIPAYIVRYLEEGPRVADAQSVEEDPCYKDFEIRRRANVAQDRAFLRVREIFPERGRLR